MHTLLPIGIPVPQVVRGRVEPFGEVWLPKAGSGQLGHLGVEVAEYFQPELVLEPGDVVVDVGANVGAFAMYAARKVKNLRFVCVEPIPALYDALAHNFETDPALAAVERDLWQVGLTRHGDAGEVEFTYFAHLPCDSTRHMDEKRRRFEQFFAAKGAAVRATLGSLGAPGRVAGRGVERIVSSLPKGALGRKLSDWATGATRVRCPLMTLDDLVGKSDIDEVALLKIDVEGAELDVLEGISEETWKRVRQIVLEGHDQNGRLARIREMLSARGYDVSVRTPEIASERGVESFLLFARRVAS